MVNIPHWPKVPLWNAEPRQDLSSTLAILKELGDPQNQLPPTIHVAGTNGKGSTIAMLKSIFMQAGYKVHSYTSPHILEFNERIQLHNEPITDYHLHENLERVKEASDKLGLNPGFFEGTTIAAFLAFAETKADILLLETGLGGRIDPTNVIMNPILTIITPISYDHMEYLGNDILHIAFEKAGIIKKNVPCVVGPQMDEVYNLLFNKCDEMEAPSFSYEYDFYAQKSDNGLHYQSQKIHLELPTPALIGDHQIQNASSVVAAIMLLNDKFQITLEQIKTGLTSVYWPGRLQLVSDHKTKELVGDNIKIYLDGAHNTDGAKALGHWIQNNAHGNVYLILGMTRNRNVLDFCTPLADFITEGIAVNVKSEPSSYSAQTLANHANEYKKLFTKADYLDDAIQHIKSINNKEPATIIVTGSLFLVADFLKM